jgi:phosphate transport system permease protein
MTTPENYGHLTPYFESNLPPRNRKASIWGTLFLLSTTIGMIMLMLLLYNIISATFGLVAIDNQVDPASLAVNGVPIEELDQEALISIIEENVSKGKFRQLEREQPLIERTWEEVYQVVIDDVVQPNEIVGTWPLVESLTRKEEIVAEVRQEHPQATVKFTSWINPQFITSPQSSDVLKAGVRTALLGTLLIIAITIVIALPIGIGAAIYLEEYASDTWINRTIQTNINNLAGVPSIIYGMLGLAIFVRAMEPITSGAFFGFTDPTTANGRTILSAGLTLSLLVLPVLIINVQEAIRAVPNSLREGAYGLGATKWQTIWHHVLPNAMPGILTGAILSISRAIGETAPLVVIGAATYITFDPDGPFSKFTTLPIQIYQWTSRAQGEYHNIAAAAILVLLTLLLSLNATAILLRNRFSRRY